MDKIWYRNPSKSEVIGHWKKRMTTQNRQKSNAKKEQKKTTTTQQAIKLCWET